MKFCMSSAFLCPHLHSKATQGNLVMKMMILTKVSSHLHLVAGCGVFHITVLDVVSGSVRPSAKAAGDTAAAAGR